MRWCASTYLVHVLSGMSMAHLKTRVCPIWQTNIAESRHNEALHVDVRYYVYKVPEFDRSDICDVQSSGLSVGSPEEVSEGNGEAVCCTFTTHD